MNTVYYLNGPTVPVLVLKPKLYGNSFVFKIYFTEEVSEAMASNEVVIKLGMILSLQF